MKDSLTFQRFAAITAILAFFTAAASDVLQGIAVDFQTKFPIDPRMFLTVGPGGSSLLRWGSLLDMVGYYLPFLPIVLFLQSWLRPKRPNWVDFYTTCALGYIFIGAVGAVIMAVVQPSLIRAYALADPGQRMVVESIFVFIWDLIYAGLWNILAVLLMGIWFIGTALLLWDERRALAILTLITGIAALADSIGNMLGVELLMMIGLLIFLLLVPIWLLWFGIDLLHKPVPIDSTDDTSPVSLPGIHV